MPGCAGEYGLSWTIIRPTAYFKDFTDMPWKHMQVRSRALLCHTFQTSSGQWPGSILVQSCLHQQPLS